MTVATATRRLAAILAADLAGYSRLMGADEEGTLERLKAVRRQLIDPKIGEHRGRIVKTTGDGLLVEFASVVDAVRCAAEVQRGMLDREPDVRTSGKSGFASASTSATSSPRAATSLATASTSRRAWKRCRAGRDLHLADGARADPRQAALPVRG